MVECHLPKPLLKGVEEHTSPAVLALRRQIMKHEFKHTHIEHHDDGSHTVEHLHEKGEGHHVKHGVPDLDGLHDSLEDHLRDPEEVEGEVEKKGIDPEKLEEAISPGIHHKMAEAVED